jgi:hypothetical protein
MSVPADLPDLNLGLALACPSIAVGFTTRRPAGVEKSSSARALIGCAGYQGPPLSLVLVRLLLDLKGIIPRELQPLRL